MSAATCVAEPVQRFSDSGPELAGQSLNDEAQCDLPGGDGPLETAWISPELLALTQRVWGRRLGREVPHEEAVEMLLNVKRIAAAFLQAGKEGRKR